MLGDSLVVIVHRFVKILFFHVSFTNSWQSPDKKELMNIE